MNLFSVFFPLRVCGFLSHTKQPLLPCLAGHAIFKLTYLSNHDYKPLYFESDAATINEIVLKVSSGRRASLMSDAFTHSV